MGSRGARLAVGLGAFVAAACGGDRALSVAAEFVRAARSVRMEVKDHSAEAVRTVEILCPDRVRVTAETTSGRLEVLAIGEDAFGRTGDGAWIRVPLTLVDAPAICGGAPWRPAAQDLPSFLQAMSRMAVAERPIGPRQVSGVPCQDWEARAQGAGPGSGASDAITLCLGTADKRPMQIKLPDATWTFAEWNADVTIDPPAAVKGEPAVTRDPVAAVQP
jgi:hypothetical protein